VGAACHPGERDFALDKENPPGKVIVMDLNAFTDIQKQALVDLLTLGMYADGNLDLIEEEIARNVLDAIPFSSDSARKYFIDASFTRARKNGASPESTRKYVSHISNMFSTQALRSQARAALEESLKSDNNLADRERELLAMVAEEFKL
jgi:DNA-binding NarL/FixJ family response regulator